MPNVVENVVAIEDAHASNEPVGDLVRSFESRWEALTGTGLTAGQRQVLTKALDDDVRRDHQGKVERAKYRIGRLLGLSARRVNDILKMDAPAALHFWGRRHPLADGPEPRIPQYFAVHFFFEDVLGWPLDEVYQRLDDLLGFGGATLPTLPQRNQPSDASPS